jgi:autotransporter-associated beta strand protein
MQTSGSVDPEAKPTRFRRYDGWPGDGRGSSVLNIFKLDAGNWTFGGQNTYTGNTTVTAGTLTFGDTSELRFRIGASGVNNAILGTGTINLNGMLVFDLSGAGTTVGDSWSIVDVGSLNESYGGSFSVSSTEGAFSETDGVWSISENGQTYEFSQATGVLTVISTGAETPTNSGPAPACSSMAMKTATASPTASPSSSVPPAPVTSPSAAAHRHRERRRTGHDLQHAQCRQPR